MATSLSISPRTPRNTDPTTLRCTSNPTAESGIARLVEQCSQDPTSGPTDLPALLFRKTVQRHRHMGSILRRCREAAACRMIVCLGVLARSAVLVRDRLRSAPASTHASLLLRRGLDSTPRLSLTPTTEGLVATCGVAGELAAESFSNVQAKL